MRHDMELCDQSGEDQDKAWLDGPVEWRRASQGFEARDREAMKLGKIWSRWTEATVKSEQGQDR